MALPVNITSIPEMIVYLNTESSNWLGVLLFTALWFVFFITMKQYNTAQAFLGASFLCLILSIVTLPIGLSSNAILGVFFVLNIAALVYMGIKKD
jgi:hypothetical protein